MIRRDRYLIALLQGAPAFRFEMVKWEHFGGFVATLSVKNFPDALYRKLQAQAKRRGRSLAREVTFLLREQVYRPRRYTIDDWRGVGAGIWRGVDVERWLDEERGRW